MFGVGGTELALILIFAFLIFGPDKLPGAARTLGRAIAKFRDAQNEMNEVIKSEIYDPEKDKEDPFKKPLDKLANLDKQEIKTESFVERKARYDRERAERKAREDADRAKAAEAAGEAAGETGAASDAATASDTATAAAGSAPTSTESAPSEPAAASKAAAATPVLSAEELYGTAPAPKRKKGGDA